jgi:hypothetical protein
MPNKAYFERFIKAYEAHRNEPEYTPDQDVDFPFTKNSGSKSSTKFVKLETFLSRLDSARQDKPQGSKMKTISEEGFDIIFPVIEAKNSNPDSILLAKSKYNGDNDDDAADSLGPQDVANSRPSLLSKDFGPDYPSNFGLLYPIPEVDALLGYQVYPLTVNGKNYLVRDDRLWCTRKDLHVVCHYASTRYAKASGSALQQWLKEHIFCSIEDTRKCLIVSAKHLQDYYQSQFHNDTASLQGNTPAARPTSTGFRLVQSPPLPTMAVDNASTVASSYETGIPLDRSVVGNNASSVAHNHGTDIPLDPPVIGDIANTVTLGHRTVSPLDSKAVGYNANNVTSPPNHKPGFVQDEFEPIPLNHPTTDGFDTDVVKALENLSLDNVPMHATSQAQAPPNDLEGSAPALNITSTANIANYGADLSDSLLRESIGSHFGSPNSDGDISLFSLGSGLGFSFASPTLVGDQSQASSAWPLPGAQSIPGSDGVPSSGADPQHLVTGNDLQQPVTREYLKGLAPGDLITVLGSHGTWFNVEFAGVTECQVRYRSVTEDGKTSYVKIRKHSSAPDDFSRIRKCVVTNQS